MKFEDELTAFNYLYLKKLRNYKETRNLTANELAKLSDISLNSIRQLLTIKGSRSIGIGVIIKFANGLGINYEDLIPTHDEVREYVKHMNTQK